MAHHHIDPLSGLSSSSQAGSPSPPNHAPPPGVFTTALTVLQEEQHAGTFITPEPSSSLEQAILAVHPSTTEVDPFPPASPATAHAMAMVDTTLPAFTLAREPTPSIHSSPSPMLSTGLPLPPTGAPFSGDNLTSSAPISSHPVASWEGRVEEARAINFPTSSDLGASGVPSIASPRLHDSLSQPQGDESDVNMESEFSDAGADLLVRRHLFPAQGQSLPVIREHTPAFGVAPPPSPECVDRITSWQASLCFDGESAAIDAMYKAVNEVIELRRGYAEFYVDNSLHFLKGSVMEGVTNDSFDSMITFVSTALSMGPRLKEDVDAGDGFFFLKNSSWYRTATAMVAAILRGCVRTADVRQRGMYELDQADNFYLSDSLRAPTTMLELLQFMVAQLTEQLLPDARELPPASVEGIRAQIWEKHESALRAELEERFSRLRARLDPDRLTSVIDQILASPSAHALPDSVSAALTEQLTDELRMQLGQRFARAHEHLDTMGLSDLIDQALEGFSRKEISDTLRDEIRRGETSRYNELLAVARNQAFTEAMDLAVSDGQATADIVCADDRAVLADLFRVQAEELEARKARMTEAHNRRVMALERKLESSHNKLEHSLEEKLALCGSSIDKQRIELANALRAMEEEREKEFIRDHAVRLGLLSLHDADDLRMAKRARNEPRSATSEAAARSRSRSVSMASDPRKRGRSPSPPAASKALVEYPSSDPSPEASAEDDTTPTASPIAPRPHGEMVAQIPIHAGNPDRTSASSIHAPGAQMDCDAPATVAEVVVTRPAAPPSLLTDDALAGLINVIQTTIRNHCTPISAHLLALDKKLDAVTLQNQEFISRSVTGKPVNSRQPPPGKAMGAAKGPADVPSAPTGSISGLGERLQTPPGLSHLVDATRPTPEPAPARAQERSTKAKGGNDDSPCFSQQPVHTPLNTPQGQAPVLVQTEAVPPAPNVPTVTQGCEKAGEQSWGSTEYPSGSKDDAEFPPLKGSSAKPGRKARATAKKRAAAAQANATVPGHVQADPNNATIPLTSRIAPTWVRTTTASMVQKQQANQGFRTVAAKVQNRSTSGIPKQGSHITPGVTEVTVIRFGGAADTAEEAKFRQRHPSVIVEAAQRGLNTRTKFPPTLLKGRWSTSATKTGNFVYTISGDVAPEMLDSLRDCLCEPFPGRSTIVPVSGWTWAQLRMVPNADANGVIYDTTQLLHALTANPCFKGVLLPVPPGWLGNPSNFKNPWADVSFAYVEKDKAVTQRASREGVCMFGRQVQFIHCGAAPSLKQCSRCHSLSHFARQCKLPEGAVRCARCGGDHDTKTHDFNCAGPHRTLTCDCPLVCILCKQKGHHARSKSCPLRQDYVAALATGPSRQTRTDHPSEAAPLKPAVALSKANASAKTTAPITTIPKPKEVRRELARKVPAIPCREDGSKNSFQCGHPSCVWPLADANLFDSTSPKLPSANLLHAYAEATRQSLSDMKEAGWDVEALEPSSMSLQAKLHNTTAPPAARPVRYYPPLASLSHAQREAEKMYDTISRFEDPHVVATVLKNGDAADARDYERFLELHEQEMPPMSPLSRAAGLEHESVMLQDSRDAEAEDQRLRGQFSDPSTYPLHEYGPAPMAIGVLPASPPLLAHDVIGNPHVPISADGTLQGPFTSLSLTAPNTNV